MLTLDLTTRPQVVDFLLKGERVRVLSSPRSSTPRPDIGVRRQHHATSHAEALTSTNTLAARLRTRLLMLVAVLPQSCRRRILYILHHYRHCQ